MTDYIYSWKAQESFLFSKLCGNTENKATEGFIIWNYLFSTNLITFYEEKFSPRKETLKEMQAPWPWDISFSAYNETMYGLWNCIETTEGFGWIVLESLYLYEAITVNSRLLGGY